MSNQTLLLRLASLACAVDNQPFRDVAKTTPPVGLGEALSQLPPHTHLSLLNQLSGRDCADSYSRLQSQRQVALFLLMTCERRVVLLHALSPRQRIAFVWKAMMRLAHRQRFAREIAHALAQMPVGFYVDLAGGLPAEMLARIHSHLPLPYRCRAVYAMPSVRAAQLQHALNALVQDDTLPPHARETTAVASGNIEAGTVDSVMTPVLLVLDQDSSIADARALVHSVSNIDMAMHGFTVVDTDNRLKGALSLHDLLHAPQDGKVADFACADIAYARASWPGRDTAGLIEAHGIVLAPVLDEADRVIGMLPADARIKVAEDTAATAALPGIPTVDDASLRTAGTSLLYRKRVFWLVVLVFGNLFSGAGLAHYEDTLQAYIVLVFFLPLLIGSGGNAGAQAATLMVRALATGDVKLRDWVAILLRECRVAGLLGLTMALAVCGLAWWRGGPDIALVVALAMVAVVMVGSLIGMSLPIVMSRFKLDPAVASAPLVTSIVDAVGVLIYLSVAVYILGVPALPADMSIP